jgi:uncharacterized membrane protein
MPSIAALHPHIVHFVIGLLVAGVLFRLVSLTGRLPFTSAAATTLILLGTLASVLAVASGDQAHGPVERVPGAYAAVEDHSTWGVRTRNLFVFVSLVDLAALGLAALKNQYARAATIAAGVVGVAGLVVLYQAADHGGDLVYSYAGGVGIRTDDPADVNQLLIAGTFHQANRDRQDGNAASSNDIVDATAKRFPEHIELQLFAAEWQLDVRSDPGEALRRLDALPLASAEPRIRVRGGLLRANALAAQGNLEGARAVLQTLQTENPGNPTLQQRLEELSR